MPKAIASTVVDAPASEVWALVRAFDGMSEWHPTLPAATIAEGRAPDAVGCVRTFATPTGAEVRERLVALDDAAMRCAYVLEHGAKEAVTARDAHGRPLEFDPVRLHAWLSAREGQA